ncbi:uncharacterized protein LOC107653148 isoform X3 [Sinocyclocheilus anshuiensis]|uniref:uncharacterized protein LOC107653148 isoform X3 n=1 Tax=Sinocyclocheilus anshuiensis TaxID=1608454 RepID=UPI0007BA9423|nr:PREDICTED: uncharacterized protein LOC107653148 isoform X3 [Sinocyclocheilus anshuiensis]
MQTCLRHFMKHFLLAESAGMDHNEPHAHQPIINQYKLMIIFSPHLSSSVHLFVFSLSILPSFPVYLSIHISVSTCLFPFPFFSLLQSIFVFSCPFLVHISVHLFLFPFHPSLLCCLSFCPHFCLLLSIYLYFPFYNSLCFVFIFLSFPVHFMSTFPFSCPSLYILFPFIPLFYPLLRCSCPSFCLVLSTPAYLFVHICLFLSISLSFPVHLSIQLFFPVHFIHISVSFRPSLSPSSSLFPVYLHLLILLSLTVHLCLIVFFNTFVHFPVHFSTFMSLCPFHPFLFPLFLFTFLLLSLCFSAEKALLLIV